MSKVLVRNFLIVYRPLVGTFSKFFSVMSTSSAVIRFFFETVCLLKLMLPYFHNFHKTEELKRTPSLSGQTLLPIFCPWQHYNVDNKQKIISGRRQQYPAGCVHPVEVYLSGTPPPVASPDPLVVLVRIFLLRVASPIILIIPLLLCGICVFHTTVPIMWCVCVFRTTVVIMWFMCFPYYCSFYVVYVCFPYHCSYYVVSVYFPYYCSYCVVSEYFPYH